MGDRHESIILHFLARVFLVPFIAVFGVYIFVHGEVSPGGGFQAGAIAAAAILLTRLTLGAEHSEHRFPNRWLVWMAIAGTGIYAVMAGILPMVFGANYLDYAAIPLEWFNAVADYQRTNRAMGIFIIELGVFIAVTGVLVVIYDHLSNPPEREDGEG